MTWNELKNFISTMDESFLNSKIKLYDFHDGQEYQIDITELLINERDDYDENDGWVPYLCINEEELDNETKTKKTSINRIS